jgi:uncharacterized protein YjiS (DUF1127 family)
MEVEMVAYRHVGAEVEAEGNLKRVEQVGEVIADGVRNLAHLFQEWRRREAEYAELAHLDDRDLHDIGIGRGEIGRIVQTH